MIPDKVVFIDGDPVDNETVTIGADFTEGTISVGVGDGIVNFNAGEDLDWVIDILLTIKKYDFSEEAA